ncbi:MULTISPECIES: conjugal transfer protein TraH [unclassified Candidatus Tisiphia]|uniref:conjugal transfer protein TraH n=1 Tax=unclassified Candidatus Tisiphia TaxID=2996318 RepID=UPI00312C82F6
MNNKIIIHTISARLYLCIIMYMPISLAWNIKDVFQGMSTNVTKAGSYQDQAAGYYSGGGMSMRTSRTSFNPISVTPPSLTMSCSGIDAYMGSFSIMSGGELVSLAKNIGSQAPAYAFQLGLKTYAPQIENALKDLRNLAMMLNQSAKADCEVTKALFAAGLPKDSAMRENVCKDMQSQSGHDYFSAGKNCRNDLAQKEALQKAQSKDQDLLLDDYNIFSKAADKIGIPEDMRESIMSMTGTIVMNNQKIYFFDSLVKDHKSWVSHLKGGESASLYHCNNRACLDITVSKNMMILPENSYQGKAKAKLELLKVKFIGNTEFDANDIGFLTSIGETFPIYDYITLEAISGISILDSSSELVATYLLVAHLKEVTGEIRKAVTQLKGKQIDDHHVVEYLKSLDRVQMFASEKQSELMTNSDRVAKRARLIEQHLIARDRS